MLKIILVNTVFKFKATPQLVDTLFNYGSKVPFQYIHHHLPQDYYLAKITFT